MSEDEETCRPVVIQKEADFVRFHAQNAEVSGCGALTALRSWSWIVSGIETPWKYLLLTWTG